MQRAHEAARSANGGSRHTTARAHGRSSCRRGRRNERGGEAGGANVANAAALQPEGTQRRVAAQRVAKRPRAYVANALVPIEPEQIDGRAGGANGGRDGGGTNTRDGGGGESQLHRIRKGLGRVEVAGEQRHARVAERRHAVERDRGDADTVNFGAVQILVDRQIAVLAILGIAYATNQQQCLFGGQIGVDQI